MSSRVWGSAPAAIPLGELNTEGGIQGIAVFNTRTERYEKVVLLPQLADAPADSYQPLLTVDEIRALHKRNDVEQTYRIDVFDTRWTPDGEINRIELRRIVIPGHHAYSRAIT